MDMVSYFTLTNFTYLPGSSTGEPTEDGLNIDGDAVLQFAASHPKYGHTILYFRYVLQAE